MNPRTRPLHVGILAIPDAIISTLSGIYDGMNASGLLGIQPAVQGRDTTMSMASGASR